MKYATERVSTICAKLVDVRIDRTMIYYALINSFTFCVDMLILTVTHSSLHWPVPVASTAGYGTALVLSFVLNRTFNFNVHGHLGEQAGKFAIAVGINYVVFVLGVMTLLVHFGVEFQVARFSAACMEGAFLYCAMRFAVFREKRVAATEPATYAAAVPD